MFRKDRNLHGGGVYIAIQEKFVATETAELDSECEAVWAKLQLYITVFPRGEGGGLLEAGGLLNVCVFQ